ncbi:MAG: hypothetical protein GOVbin4162_125 [Prokaryotic dsDNA virus sp.]|nr:MAG: hypothetical protein GOVbin4162_125 [Prokaryotic dsDNA virus sp.]|tara:strand:- start:2738 stop:2989 length:252 start_codon:yes stop_codon:yes gene_type:complete
MSESVINIDDIRIFSYDRRALYSGSFGFHMAKGVHIIHIPTGIEVKEDSSRSQHRNKAVAMKRLEEELLTHYRKLADTCGTKR